jgi:hydroxymethylpyrimidine/phosphomethylpyrimidine kinase
MSSSGGGVIIIVRYNGAEVSGTADTLTALAAELPEGHDLKAAIETKLVEDGEQD